MKELEEAIKAKAFLNLQTFMIEGGEIIPHQKMVFLKDVLELLKDVVCIKRKEANELTMSTFLCASICKMNCKLCTYDLHKKVLGDARQKEGK